MNTLKGRRWRGRVANPRLPLWVRVACYAEGNADSGGHALLAPGQLKACIDATIGSSSYSRAIATAVTNHWLDPSSSARCLVIDGAAKATCKATHKAGRH